MSATYRFAMLFLCVLCLATMVSAQDETRVALQKTPPVITAGAADGKFRFSSPAGVARIRVQILSASAETAFDSGWKDGNVLDWPIESPGQPLANGLYRCVVMVSDLDGRVTQKEATFIAHDGQVSIESRAGTDGLTIVGAGENGPKITMLTHDDKNGAIVNTSGDLIFRFGKFFAGSDAEKMRLTAEGNLGIGTDKPQAPLDVNGLIRTSKGIMFSDGTILTTAAGLPAVTGSGEVIPRRPVAPVVVRGGLEPMSPARSVSPNGLTPRTAAVADYQFKVDSAGVHIGTTSAFGLDVAGNATLASNLKLPLTAATGGAGVIMLGGVPFAHSAGGATNTFVGNYAGGNAFTTTGTNDTGTGVDALIGITTGTDNTANGAFALANNTSGVGSTATGSSALLNNLGNYNTATGLRTLQNNTTGQSNTAIGVDALASNTTGDSNTATGTGALQYNTNSYNTATGFFSLQMNTTGVSNTANGAYALQQNTTGKSNTASGNQALFSNISASNNTAIGDLALSRNAGDNNTASGSSSLRQNTTGSYNEALGASALYANTSGYSNAALGAAALITNTTGTNNTAIGNGALYSITTGYSNIALGFDAGYNLTGDDNTNIDIGNSGSGGDRNTIRIGFTVYGSRTFLAGVRDVTTPYQAVAVVVDGNGQLGTYSSSRRYKFDISDMDSATDSLMRLRPVTFRYLAHGENAPLQYGLIAEEVDEVYPEMVARNKDGEIETVMYQFLAPMLLNEVQKQHRHIEEQRTTIATLTIAREKQQKTIDALSQRLDALESQVARGK